MKRRTKQFGLRVIRLVQSLPRAGAADVIGRQLLRAATAVGANYKSSCRARTDKDFLARMGIVEEEADESSSWLELLLEANLVTPVAVGDLLGEADEIARIVVASIKTAKSRVAKASSRHPAAVGARKSEIRPAPQGYAVAGNPKSEIG